MYVRPLKTIIRLLFLTLIPFSHSRFVLNDSVYVRVCVIFILASSFSVSVSSACLHGFMCLKFMRNDTIENCTQYFDHISAFEIRILTIAKLKKEEKKTFRMTLIWIVVRSGFAWPNLTNYESKQFNRILEEACNRRCRKLSICKLYILKFLWHHIPCIHLNVSPSRNAM